MNSGLSIHIIISIVFHAENKVDCGDDVQQMREDHRNREILINGVRFALIPFEESCATVSVRGFHIEFTTVSFHGHRRSK